MRGRILTADERAWARSVWGPGWATEGGALTKDIIDRRKAFVRSSCRGHPYRNNLVVQPPDDTIVAPRATLHYDVAVHVERRGDVDEERIVHLSSPKDDRSRMRLWHPPFRSPHVFLRPTTDPHDMTTPRPDDRVVWVEGVFSDYDGEAPYMTHIVMDGSPPDVHGAIEKLLQWLASSTVAWSTDERGFYGPVDGWFGQPIDRTALILWHVLYERMTADQRERLVATCNFEEVHVVFGYGPELIVVEPPTDDDAADDKGRWAMQAQRRGCTTDAPFLYKHPHKDLATLRRLLPPTGEVVAV